MAIPVEPFAPSATTTKWTKRGDLRSLKHRATSSLLVRFRDVTTEDEKDLAQRIQEAQALGGKIIAASLLLGSVLVASPGPSTAMTHESPELQSTTIISESKRTASSASMVSTSSMTISQELRIQQKYLDLAGELKEELKYRANQGREIAEEKAKGAFAEAQERQQTAAAERAAKLKEYDDMFDQSEKDRNEYYSRKILSRDTYLQDVKKQEESEDRTDFNRMMQALGPDATAVDELKYKLQRNLNEENSLRASLAENEKKDPADTDTRTERTLLKVKIEKAEQVSAKIRKDIAFEESLEAIKAEREAEVRIYQARADKREQELQEKIEKIRLAKEKEKEAYAELRARKREELEDLKFRNQQAIFERKFDDLDRFEKRKDILATQQRERDAKKVKALGDELYRLAQEDTSTNPQ